MNVFKIPVSVTYLTGRVLLIGAISASPMFLAQKKDSLKEKSIDEIVVVGYGTQKKVKFPGLFRRLHWISLLPDLYPE
ncbi:hypothetical protein OWR28_04050 [Chryseobacterium sp. 1B4]